jgi:SagB-type dehydrogenase family enzyme
VIDSTRKPGDAARDYHERSKWWLLIGPDGSEQILAGIPPDLGPALGAQAPANEPKLFKVYRNAPEVPTGARPIETVGTALAALASDGREPDGDVIPDLPTIGALLQRSNGILKTWTSPWGKEVAFRAAGQTGARFHLELYLVTGDLPELAAGVYHFDAQANTLRTLRLGDYRGFVVEATGHEPAAAAAPAILIVTSQLWRNAWRYLDHAFRHVFWDMGTMLTNTLAMAAGAEVPAEVVFGFAEGDIEQLLGIDGKDELVAGLVALGRTSVPFRQVPDRVPGDRSGLCRDIAPVRASGTRLAIGHWHLAGDSTKCATRRAAHSAAPDRDFRAVDRRSDRAAAIEPALRQGGSGFVRRLLDGACDCGWRGTARRALPIVRCLSHRQQRGRDRAGRLLLRSAHPSRLSPEAG